MRRFITFFSAIACLMWLAMPSLLGQWANNAPHIYNTNASNVGISNGALWAPAHKLHINTLAVNPAGVMAESFYNLAPQRVIGYYRILNTFSGDYFNISLRRNAAGVHEMLQSCFITGFGFAEYNYFNYATRKFEMRNGINDAEFLNTGRFLISSVGNTGIGVANPLEKLDINGAVRIGNTANNNAGTIRWDGANFLGFNGAGWVNLDYQPAGPVTWLVIPNPVAPNNPQLYPGTPPASVTNALPGMPNFGGWFHAVDAPAPGMYPHQLMLESITGLGGVLGASQLFRISNGFSPPFVDFSMGIFSGDGTFKLTSVPNLFPTIYSDNISMLRVFPTGIVDLPNQSRVRAYQMDPTGVNQMIIPNTWTPVNFTFDQPAPQGYDEQNEFVLAIAANQPAPPENAFFVAQKEGYYQVNARVAFQPEYSQQGGPVQFTPMSYITIAIFTGPGPGATAIYAQGDINQLGMPAGPLFYNNGINVSDVVYLMPGQIISICVYHTALTPMDLLQGPEKVYVSIHKVS